MKRLFTFALLAILVSSALPATAAITINHTAASHNASGTNTITVTSTTGNLLVLQVSTNSGSAHVTAVSDNKNTTYTVAGSTVTSGTSQAQIYYFPNATTGATTVTLTMSANIEYAYQWFDLGGALTSSPLETSAVLTNQAAGANPTGPSVSPVATADIIITAICTQGNVTAVAASTGAPTGTWTGAFPDSSNTGSGFAYNISTGAGTYAPHWTMVSAAWGGITAAFKANVSTTYVTQVGAFLPGP